MKDASLEAYEESLYPAIREALRYLEVEEEGSLLSLDDSNLPLSVEHLKSANVDKELLADSDSLDRIIILAGYLSPLASYYLVDTFEEQLPGLYRMLTERLNTVYHNLDSSYSETLIRASTRCMERDRYLQNYLRFGSIFSRDRVQTLIGITSGNFSEPSEIHE